MAVARSTRFRVTLIIQRQAAPDRVNHRPLRAHQDRDHVTRPHPLVPPVLEEPVLAVPRQLPVKEQLFPATLNSRRTARNSCLENVHTETSASLFMFLKVICLNI